MNKESLERVKQITDKIFELDCNLFSFNSKVVGPKITEVNIVFTLTDKEEKQNE